MLSLVSWDIDGFDVEEYEERSDRIEIELEGQGLEIEVRVRLKDSGELDIRLKVE